MNSVDPEQAFDTRPAEDEDAGGQLGVAQLVDIVRRRWKLLAAITLSVLAATIATTFLITPRYDATARIKVDPTQRTITDRNADRITSPQADQARIDTEVEILRSREIAAAVAREFNLSRDPEFVDSATLSRGPESAMEQATTALSTRTSVDRDSDNYIVKITVRSESPTKSAKLANAVTQYYLDNSVRRRTGTAAQQSQFLDDRLRSLGGDLQSLENQIARYRGQAGIVEGGGSGTITDQQVAPLSTQLAQAEAAAAAARAQLSAARAQIASGNIGAVNSVLTSSVIVDLRRQRADALRDKAQVDARYGERHPESVRAAEQLATIDRQLGDEARRIVAGLDSTARAAEASAGSLRGSLGQLRGQQATETRASVVADGLERQAKAKQAQYDQLSQSAQNVGEAERNNESTATIVDRAIPPLKPAAPNKPLFAALGAILGLLAGFSSILIVEFLTDTLRSGVDIERRLRLPYLGSVPRLTAAQLAANGGKAVDYVVSNPLSSYAEAMRTIRSSLLLDRRRLKVVSILSSLPGEGKTTTSISLGRIMALSGDRVILLDCDLRRGGIATLVPHYAGAGLVGVLKGEVTLDQAIARDEATGLDLLPLQGQMMTAVDLFGGDRMRQMTEQLAERYDFVLLDTAPILAVADARVLAALADTSILVFRAEHTPLNAARSALAKLRSDGSRVLGGALQMVSGTKRLGSSDPAYYYGEYRGYHQN